MSARAHRLRRRGGPGPLVVVAACAGALLGASQTRYLVAHTQGRTPVSPERYQLVVPAVAATGQNPADAARSGLADGVFVLETRAFGAPERLLPVSDAAVRLDVALASGSDPVTVHARSAAGNNVELGTLSWQGWTAGDGVRRTSARAGGAVVEFVDGLVRVDGVAAGRGNGPVELAPVGHARLAALTLYGADGAVLLADTFATPVTTKQRAAWALWLATSAGALAAAAARAAPAGRLWLVLTTLFAAGVFNLGYGAWTALQERLYLATIPVGTLRCALSAAAALPLLHGVLAELGAFGLVRGLPRLPRAAGLALAGAATLAASRGLSGVDAALLLVATATAALPWLTRPGENPAAILLRDAPALLATAALGLGAGLLPATLWRLAVLAGDAPLHLRSAGRAPAFATFALLLSLPVAAEAALRATSLAQGWSPDALAGASVGEGVARVAAPFWTGSCGDAPRHPVWVFGGSATGGAWQFRGHPEAFFPAALHDRLCAAGLAVETVNYGDSGRDTFDIRQMLPSLLGGAHPDLVVLYVGVNDLFTLDAPVTRKERAALLAARGATLSTVGTLAAKSRLFTGLSLLVRPVTTHAAVVSVPLPDAEENVRAVLAAVKAAGGKVLLAPELVRTAEAAGMLGYAKMLQTVCDDTAAVCVDPAPTFALDRDTFLVDRNHLSESGAAKLADALFPAAVGALGLTGAPPAAAAPPRSPR